METFIFDKMNVLTMIKSIVSLINNDLLHVNKVSLFCIKCNELNVNGMPRDHALGSSWCGPEASLRKPASITCKVFDDHRGRL